MTNRRWLVMAVSAASVLAVLTVSTAPSQAARVGLRTHQTSSTYAVSDGSDTVVIQKKPWRLSLQDASGTTVVREQDPKAPDLTTNVEMQINKDFDQHGQDKAYPGLPIVSTEPLSYLRGDEWQHVTAFLYATVTGMTATIHVETSDKGSGVVTLVFRGRAVDLTFTPSGEAPTAVGESFAESATAHYYGGGGRFIKDDLTGLNIPLWVSHGIGSDEYVDTNEIAVPYLASTSGWAMYERSGARGDFAVGIPERPGVISSIVENSSVELTLYTGSLQQMLSAFTLDQGRNPVPPQWAFTPIWWDDTENNESQIETNIATLQREGIPVGGYLIDNPWQLHQGDFAPSKANFPTWSAFISKLHGEDIRIITWVSPFYDPNSTVAKDGAVPVKGTPLDGDDHTYIPARGINPHVDLTDPTSYAAEVKAATALLESGVDGFKLDRSEEDLGDGAEFASGIPNRLEHSQYVLSYDKAMRQACTNAHPDGDCLLIARGGVAGSSHYVGNWAGDTIAVEGPLGLSSVVTAMLSEAMSGQPIFGSDIGGYSERETGEIPTSGTFARWAQLGAVSPIWESPNHPSDYDLATQQAIKVATTLHERLAPYTEAAAQKAAQTGVPITEPLVLAYPNDPVAPTISDEYLFDGCLLAAPITVGVDQEGPATRSVYLPQSSWTNVFTGVTREGPTALTQVSSYDTFPLYESKGCDIPKRVFSGLSAGVLPIG